MRLYPAILVRPRSYLSELLDVVAAALDGFGVVALDEIENGAAVRAFFSKSGSRDEAMQALREAFPAADVLPLDVSDENWAERSQAGLKAVRVGALTVAPPWDLPSDRTGLIVIVPSTGFGTGHHATTRLCVAALQRVPIGGKTVVDLGTGSGVLGLAAAKLGASRVLAIDNDPDAISNALENKALNELEVDFRCQPLDSAEIVARGPFDLVLANLTGGVLIRFAPILQSLTGRTGRLVLSGLREDEEEAVIRAFDAASESRESEDGWVCLVLKHDAETRPKGLREP